MNIGIERHTKLIYEGASLRLGYPVWPSPIMFQMTIATEDDDELVPAKINDLHPNSFIFREETYNSSSRVRRGRIYQAEESQPVYWTVYPHPALPHEIVNMSQGILASKKEIYSYNSLRLQPYLKNNNIKRPIFLLGAENGFTIWTLVHVETTATGDEIVALRARKSIGALPKLHRKLILKSEGKDAISFIDKLEDELFRAGPESVVDRSREATTAVLSKYLQSLGKDVNGNDLVALASVALAEKLEIVSNSARTIARLHARGKHAEQEKNNPRKITEQDAELAVQLVGVILCDIGWAEW